MMNHGQLEVLKASLSLLVAVVTLSLGWLIGQRLTIKWNLIQKQRETDIAVLQQFYLLYGEFKEVSKIWRVVKRNKSSTLVVPSDIHWTLLTRACAVESKSEAIVVKIASERDLSTAELRKLGLFRQSLQQLRESIRDDIDIPSNSRGAEYVFFNNLAADVGWIMVNSIVDASADSRKVGRRLREVTDIGSSEFKEAMAIFKNEYGGCPQEMAQS